MQVRANFFIAIAVCFLTSACFSTATYSKVVNGFDFSDASVPVAHISGGGPPRDGIPAIDSPTFVSPQQDHGLTPSDRVLGMNLNGVAKAYPIRILNWHELVNDEFAGKGVLVSFCPLCGTGMAFSSDVAGKRLTFGVSGLLYNSDVLFYDRQTESLWSQLLARGISGKMNHHKLAQLPLTHTTWGQWLSDHPNTQVLSPNLGFSRNYKDDPYRGYEKTRRLFFKVAAKIPKEYHPKERVLGLLIDGEARAYPFTELRKQSANTIPDTLAGQNYVVNWHADSETATIVDPKGQPIVSTVAFWFAWYAFHPDTDIFRSGD